MEEGSQPASPYLVGRLFEREREMRLAFASSPSSLQEASKAPPATALLRTGVVVSLWKLKKQEICRRRISLHYLRFLFGERLLSPLHPVRRTGGARFGAKARAGSSLVTLVKQGDPGFASIRSGRVTKGRKGRGRNHLQNRLFVFPLVLCF